MIVKKYLKFIIPVAFVFEVYFSFPTATVTVAGAYVFCLRNSFIALAMFSTLIFGHLIVTVFSSFYKKKPITNGSLLKNHIIATHYFFVMKSSSKVQMFQTLGKVTRKVIIFYGWFHKIIFLLL
jgi:hypothetical protein